MKLTVLGCWAPYPRAGGACSGYLLESMGNNILIECGNGALSNLLKHIDFMELDAVVVSHLHPDHYLDLFCLRHAVRGARRLRPELKPLPLYIPGEPGEQFAQISRFTEAFEIHPIEKLPSSKFGNVTTYQVEIGKSGRVALSFVRTDHPLPTYGLTAEGADGKLFFSADTKWTDYLPGFAAGADLALCEASVVEEDRDYTSVGHLTAAQAGTLAREAGAGICVITHFWPEYSLATLESEAASGYGKPVTVAREGLVIEFGKRAARK